MWQPMIDRASDVRPVWQQIQTLFGHPAVVGRYVTGPAGVELLTRAEADFIHAHGAGVLLLVSGFTQASVMNVEDSVVLGVRAAKAARDLGAPAGTVLVADLETWSPTYPAMRAFERTIRPYRPGYYASKSILDKFSSAMPWRWVADWTAPEWKVSELSRVVQNSRAAYQAWQTTGSAYGGLVDLSVIQEGEGVWMPPGQSSVPVQNATLEDHVRYFVLQVAPLVGLQVTEK